MFLFYKTNVVGDSWFVTVFRWFVAQKILGCSISQVLKYKTVVNKNFIWNSYVKFYKIQMLYPFSKKKT